MRSLFLRHLVFSGFVSALFSGLIATAPVSAFQEVVREEPVVSVEISSEEVILVPILKQEYAALEFFVKKPTGTILFGEFRFGEKPFVSLRGNPHLEQEVLDNGRDREPKPESKDDFPNGIYTVEVRVAPSKSGQTQSASFCVEDGRIVLPQDEEERQ